MLPTLSAYEDTPAAQVSLRVVRGLADAVDHTTGSRRSLLTAAGITGWPLDIASARISRAEFYRVVEVAVRTANDPALGLHWCERLSDSVFNPITQLIRHATTLRVGIELMSTFHGVLSDPPSYELVESGNTMTMRCYDVSAEIPVVQRFVGEMLVSGFARIVRAFDAKARFARISFAYAAPSYRDEYTRVLGHAVQFEQSFTGLTFDSVLLDLVSPYRDKDVHEALRRIAELRLMEATHGSLASYRVRAYLVEQSARQHLRMPHVARALGMSARSLRRRLHSEGTLFNDLVHEASASVAKQLLRRECGSIQEVAYEMGFSHSSAFHRAFKRWTGLTPREFRDRELADQIRPSSWRGGHVLFGGTGE